MAHPPHAGVTDLGARALKTLMSTCLSLLLLLLLSMGGWAGFTTWQETLVDVVGLECAITNPNTGGKEQVGLILRKTRKDEAPTSLWAQEGQGAKPMETHKVCKTTPDQLFFRGAGVSCATEYESSFRGEKKEAFDFTINRKDLQLKIGDLAPEHCEEALPAEIRGEWRKAYDDKLKGNRF